MPQGTTPPRTRSSGFWADSAWTVAERSGHYDQLQQPVRPTLPLHPPKVAAKPALVEGFQLWAIAPTLDITVLLYSLVVMTNLCAAFSALSDPTRLAILARLAKGEATVTQLVEPFEMTQPAISRHLKVLEEAGLIVRRVDGARRPCRLRESGMEAMEEWLAMMRKTFAQNYRRLDQVLANMQSHTKRSGLK